MPPFNKSAHPGCVECGLWRYATRWRIDPIVSDGYVEGGILVVVDAPNAYDEQNNELMSTDVNGGKFLREDTLAELDVGWVLVSGLRCNPGIYKENNPDTTDKNKGKPRNPGVVRIRHCRKFLEEAIAEYRPRVIVGLGDIALNAIFDSKAYPDRPNTVTAAYGEIYENHHSGAAVLIGYHPAMHSSGNKDLIDDYGIVFGKARDLVVGENRSPEVRFTIINTPLELKRLGRSAPNRVCGDFETKNNLKVRDWITIWANGAEALCLAYSFFEHEDDAHPKNFLIPAHLFGYTDLLIQLFAGREFVAHNAKFDIQVGWIFLGFCIQEVATRVYCTLNELYVRDTAYIGNSLEKRSMLHLGVDGWKWMVDRHLDARNQEIAEIHAPYEKQLRFAKKKFVDTGDVVWEAAAEGLVDTITALPPKNSADFSCVPVDGQNGLYHYCCTDTDRNIRLARWIDQNLEPIHPITDQIIQRTIFVTMWIERTGLPISAKRVRQLKKVVDKEVERLYRVLCRYDQAIDALFLDEDFVKLYEAGKIDRDRIREFMSPKSPTFLVNLATTTGTIDQVPVDKKTSNYSFDKKSLEHLSGGDEATDPLQRLTTWTPHEDKTDAQLIWTLIFAIRKMFDMGGRFIKDLISFDVNGRIHTNYKTCKVDVVRAQGTESGGGTGTGRLASADPNLQNIKKDPILRYVFTPVDDPEFGPDWIMAEYDYDRIEPVCLTVVTGCREWTTCIQRGLDLYRYTGNTMYKDEYGFDLSGPDKEVDAMLKAKIPEPIRDVCKMCTLAVSYGMSKYALSAAGGVTKEQAQEYLDTFFATLPEIAEWQAGIAAGLKEHKPLVSPLYYVREVHGLPRKGRRDYFSKYNSLYREFINWPIQQMASVITIWKMYELIRAWKKAGLWWKYIRLTNIVHDCGSPIYHRKVAVEADAIARRVLVDTSTLPIPFHLPLGVTPKYGLDLGGMKKLGESPVALELGIR